MSFERVHLHILLASFALRVLLNAILCKVSSHLLLSGALHALLLRPRLCAFTHAVVF
jgi:hypothetical protein